MASYYRSTMSDREELGLDVVGADGLESLAQAARSGLWSVLAYAAGAGAAFIISIVVGRALGPSALGRYSYFMWVLRVAPTVVALGVPLALSKVVAEKVATGAHDQAWGLFRFVVRAHVLLLVPVAGVGLAATFATDGAALGLAAVLVGGGLVALLVADVEGMLAGLQRFRALSILATTTGVAQVVGTVAAVQLGSGWLGLLGVFVTIGAVSLGVMVGFSRRVPGRVPAGRVPRSVTGSFIRYAGIAAATVVVEALLWGRLEVLFLNWYRASDELGWYSAALRLSSLAAVLPLVAGRPLLPEFSRLRGLGANDQVTALFRRACTVLAAVSAPVALVGAALAPPAMRLVYGDAFEPATTAAVILTATSFLLALAGPLGMAMLTGPRPRTIVQLGAFAIATNVALDLALIPRYGIEGAATANGVAQLSWVLLAVRAVAQETGLHYPVTTMLRAVGAAAVAASAATLVVRATDDLPGVLLGGVVAVAVYAVLANRLGVLGADELAALGVRRRGGVS